MGWTGPDWITELRSLLTCLWSPGDFNMNYKQKIVLYDMGGMDGDN